MEVALKTNRNEISILEGTTLPPLVQVEDTSSMFLMIDSKDRSFGTDGDFTIDLNYRVPRPRYIKLKKLGLPKIPNVNPLNNTIQIKHAGGTTASFTVPPGIYNTTTLANALTSSINTAFAAAAIADTVTSTYDQVSRTFTISSVNVLNWFFVDTCTFITRGASLCGFSGSPLVTAVSTPTQYSGISGMIYSRYLTVSSRSLNQYAFCASAMSGITQPKDVMAIVDLTNMLDASDFDVSIPYSGVYKTIPVDGSTVNLACRQRTMNESIDFKITDSYGFNVDESLTLGAPYGPNTLGVALTFVITQ